MMNMYLFVNEDDEAIAKCLERTFEEALAWFATERPNMDYAGVYETPVRERGC